MGFFFCLFVCFFICETWPGKPLMSFPSVQIMMVLEYGHTPALLISHHVPKALLKPICKSDPAEAASWGPKSPPSPSACWAAPFRCAGNARVRILGRLGENSQPLGEGPDGVVRFVPQDETCESFPQDKSFSCFEPRLPL